MIQKNAKSPERNEADSTIDVQEKVSSEQVAAIDHTETGRKGQRSRRGAAVEAGMKLKLITFFLVVMCQGLNHFVTCLIGPFRGRR